jgi:hypothetical protein
MSGHDEKPEHAIDGHRTTATASSAPLPNTILLPHAVAEKCYLSEALCWVALHRCPLASTLETGEDSRTYDKYIWSLRPPIDDELVSGDECELAGLPVNPEWKSLVEFEHYLPPDHIRRILEYERDEARLSDWRAELPVSEAHYKSVAEWNERLESFLDLYAAKLFVALREGTIGAEGKKLSKRALRAARRGGEDENAVDFSSGDWKAIPHDFWVSGGIDWKLSCGEGRDCAYALILVGTAELFRAFPAPPLEPSSRVARLGGGYVLLNDTGTALNMQTASRGRPPFPWDDFHVEVARRAAAGQLGTKQEALIEEMSNWCISRWGRSPGRSTISQKLKPYFDVLVRSPEE